MDPFVPDQFRAPMTFESTRFRLEKLDVQHNEQDYAAWSGSMDHIRRTPGFEPSPQQDDPWPHPMTLEDNRRDLKMHADHFDQRSGFTYTVLDPSTDEVIGCLYIYPDTHEPDVDARVRSWVTAERADLDGELAATIQTWLDERWPFDEVRYR